MLHFLLYHLGFINYLPLLDTIQALPAACILMGGKHQTIYEIAFQAVKIVCHSHGANITLTHIMSDFEVGLRNNLLKVNYS